MIGPGRYGGERSGNGDEQEEKEKQGRFRTPSAMATAKVLPRAIRLRPKRRIGEGPHVSGPESGAVDGMSCPSL